MTEGQGKKPSELSSVRDMVESIWVAIVLAFVLRGFLIEAFVIPTGSMAPRLLGEHLPLQCPSCGYVHSFGIPRVYADDPNFRRDHPIQALGARCPNCNYPYPGDLDHYLDNGDRVLVLKYLYQFRQPQPWDVVVFKNPQDNRQNYIKRLIGLPGESIEIVHGDVFVKNGPEDEFRIRRKPLQAQEAMWQVVFDNDYRPDPNWLSKGSSANWAQRGQGQWDLEGLQGRRFTFTGREPSEIAFQPVTEGCRDETQIQKRIEQLRAQLNAAESQYDRHGIQQHIDRLWQADRYYFLPRYGYNDPSSSGAINEDRDVCTDLKLCFTFVPKKPHAKVSLLLISFENQFKALVDSAGTAELCFRRGSDAPWETWGRTAIAPMEIDRGCEIALTNADLSVSLWLNGQKVLERAGNGYPENYSTLKARMLWMDLQRIKKQSGTDADRDEKIEGNIKDLESRVGQLWEKGQREFRDGVAQAAETMPSLDKTMESFEGVVPAPRARIGAEGGASELWHVGLFRDVYYTSQHLDRLQNNRPEYDYARKMGLDFRSGGWGTMDQPITLACFKDNPDLDEFYVLGDNSPQSLDSRAWTAASSTLRLTDEKTGARLYKLGTVPRYNMIGKAMFVYWPAGFRPPKLPGLPIMPNVGRMRLIR